MDARIGLEIHAYLNLEKVKTKLFCECPINYQEAEPNTNICPICTSQPGSKPMLTNKEALDRVIEIGLMLNCRINNKFMFQRKHYNWPDLPSGYQRTISGSYSSNVGVEGKFNDIGIWEVHLEEDPAKWDPRTGEVDYNRSGMPLIEIVTAPDLKNPEEARKWLRNLIIMLNYIKAVPKGISIKADVNVSVGKHPRVEVKNVNSFKNVCKAIEYEFKRQEKVLQENKIDKQETRMFDENEGITKHMRYKEQADDYRFIPEPDLPTIYINNESIDGVKKKLPENPENKIKRFIKEYKLSKYDAEVLSSKLVLADLFDKVAKKIDAKTAANWLTIDLLKLINENEEEDIEINDKEIINLLELVTKKIINDTTGKEILRKLMREGWFNVKEHVEKNKLGQVSDKEELERICESIVKKNPKAVSDYKKGKEDAFNFLLGMVMKETKGKANPDVIRGIIKEFLK